MCGRFTLAAPDQPIQELLDLVDPPELEPRYNIAPTQPVAVLRTPEGRAVRKLEVLRWGLIPSWAKDPAIGNRMINARSETAAEKPSFRTAMRYRRCLIPADGFYEWQKLAKGKQPHYLRMREGRPFAFAGLWEHWEAPDGSVIESCTILTTNPNALLEPIHDRMPVILRPEHFEQWLDPGLKEAAKVAPLLRPFDAGAMEAYPITTHVNSPRHDDPDCIKPRS